MFFTFYAVSKIGRFKSGTLTSTESHPPSAQKSKDGDLDCGTGSRIKRIGYVVIPLLENGLPLPHGDVLDKQLIPVDRLPTSNYLTSLSQIERSNEDEQRIFSVRLRFFSSLYPHNGFLASFFHSAISDDALSIHPSASATHRAVAPAIMRQSTAASAAEFLRTRAPSVAGSVVQFAAKGRPITSSVAMQVLQLLDGIDPKVALLYLPSALSHSLRLVAAVVDATAPSSDDTHLALTLVDNFLGAAHSIRSGRPWVIPPLSRLLSLKSNLPSDSGASAHARRSECLRQHGPLPPSLRLDPPLHRPHGRAPRASCLKQGSTSIPPSPLVLV